MPLYRYKALRRDGELATGEIEASDQAAAVHQLQAQSHLPIYVSDSRPQAWLKFFKYERSAVSTQSVADFFSQLASLVGAGLPVERALTILKETAAQNSLRLIITELLENVRAGASFSHALAQYPGIFPEFHVTTIKAAEEGGFLLDGLQKIASQQAKYRSLISAFKSALIYPTILLCMSTLAILFILTVVLPQFRTMFEGSGVELPLPAAILMALSGFITTHSSLLLLLFACMLFGAIAASRSPAIRNRVSDLILRLPLVGDTLRRLDISKFSYALGLLLENGAPLQSSIRLAHDIVSNTKLRDALLRTAEHVREGRSFAESLESESFPHAMIELIRIGEETGRLPAALNHLAELFDKDVRRQLERIVAYLVPSITIGLGALIALLIASVFSALISINELVL